MNRGKKDLKRFDALPSDKILKLLEAKTLEEKSSSTYFYLDAVSRGSSCHASVPIYKGK
jgi:hypothetical protein